MAEQKRHMDVPQERFLESSPPKDSFPSIRGQSKGICNGKCTNSQGYHTTIW
jgi:hypothetical protein